MTIALVSPDLLISSRVDSMVEAAGARFERVDHPGDLPPPDQLSVVLVDWAYRRPGWGQLLDKWAAAGESAERPRIILFGPHTDLSAHAEARSAGLGPMWARSRLLTALPQLLAAEASRS